MKKQKKRKDYTNKEAITIILFYLLIFIIDYLMLLKIFIAFLNKIYV